MPKSDAKKLTPEQARHALYIDFEGGKDKPPVLLGTTHWAKALKVHQYVTDPRFDSLGKTSGIEVLTLPDAIERIIQRAEKKDRLLVAWTTHELDQVRQYAPEHLDRFWRRFRNARAIAEYWRNSCHDGDKPATGQLVKYLPYVGYEVPEAAGPGKAGATIKVVGASLARDPSGGKLTEKQHARWLDLLDHNRHDCAGMRAICIQAAVDVERQA